ncbi:hypothetical protein PENTCL1PPCAC_9666, partial [Pristionchus entomophagus]
ILFRMLRSAVAVSSHVAAGVRTLSTSVVCKDRPARTEVDEVFKDKTQAPRRQGFSFNRVELVGGVSEEPSKKVAKNGKDYITFKMITNSSTTRADGERFDHIDKHLITVAGKTAEYVERNIQKGTRVMVLGRLSSTGGRVQEDGTTSPVKTTVFAETVMPLARASDLQNRRYDQ